MAGRRLSVWWRARGRARVARLLVTVARPAGLAVRAFPVLAGLLLLSYGAGLVYRPAGFLSAGVLILADVVAGRVAAGRAPKRGEGG